MASLILQRRGKPFQPVFRALAPLVQDDPKVVSVEDEIFDAVILLLEIARFREDAPGFQQRTLVQAFHLESILCHGGFSV